MVPGLRLKICTNGWVIENSSVTRKNLISGKHQIVQGETGNILVSKKSLGALRQNIRGISFRGTGRLLGWSGSRGNGWLVLVE